MAGAIDASGTIPSLFAWALGLHLMNRILLVLAVWAIFGLVCLIATYAHAEPVIRFNVEPQAVYTCADLRAALAMFKSEAALIEFAKQRGATPEQIAKAKQCLR